MSFWSMILAFAPWVAFKIILYLPLFNELTMLKIGLVTAASISAYRILKGLDKGIIAWGSGAFFGFSLIMVVGLTNVWYMIHLGIFSNGTLALMTWASVILGNPFTLAYAKQTVDPKYWDTPRFIHKNYKITTAWGLSFSMGVVDALLKQQYPEIQWYVFEIIDDSAMLCAILFTMHLSKPPSQTAEEVTIDSAG